MTVYVLVHENDHADEFDLAVFAAIEAAQAAADRKGQLIGQQRNLPDPVVWWSSPLHGELVHSAAPGRLFAGEHFTIEPRNVEDGVLVPRN